MRQYTLHKVSDPGFELHTNQLHHVVQVLEDFVCDGCKTSDSADSGNWPDNYDSLSYSQKIEALLSTSCGCEFDLDVNVILPTTKLWLLTNVTVGGYDTYDSCVVAAATEERARQYGPAGESTRPGRNWCYPQDVQIEYIGTTDRQYKEGTVICRSFNAG